MISWREIKDSPDIRRVFSTLLLGISLWGAGVVFLSNTAALDRSAMEALRESDTIIQSASVYRSFPSAGQNNAPVSGVEAMSDVSRIVEELKLRDKMQQLNSSPTGVSLQFERLYKNEFFDLLSALQKRGLTLKMVEMKALPVAKERLWSVSMIVGNDS